MKRPAFLLPLLFLPSLSSAQNTPANCPESAEFYEQRYAKHGEGADLKCMHRALDRELAGQVPYNCSEEAQDYGQAYEQEGKMKDLVCYNAALRRELFGG